MRTTWMPHEKHGRLTQQSDLPNSVFAFPKQRKEPLTDERHVRNAVARFDQVIDVSDADRALAFANIEKAAKILQCRPFGDVMARTRRPSAAPPKRGCRQRRGDQAQARRIERGCRKGNRDEARERGAERESRCDAEAQARATRPLSICISFRFS